MAININLIYEAVKEQVSKETGVGYLNPAAFNSFANQSQVELFNRYAQIYQDEQRVTDKIRPFIKRSVLGIDSTGKMTYPTDYVNKVAIRAFDPIELAAEQKKCDPQNPINYNSIKQIKVKTIDNNKLGDRLDSSILAPDLSHPINVFYDTYNQFYPINLGSCFFEYLRQPVEVVWGYTLDANGLEVYNSATSVNFEFDWLMRNEIIASICGYFAVSVSDGELEKSSDKILQNQS